MTRSPWRSASCGALALLLLVGCSNDNSDDQDPVPEFTGVPTSAPTSSSAAPDAGTASEQQVVEGYLAYLAAVDGLLAGGDPDPARLSDVATAEESLRVAQNTVPAKTQGLVGVGSTAVVGTPAVTVEGATALLEGCVDGRDLVLVPAGTLPTPGQTSPVEPSSVQVSLVLEGDVWKVRSTGPAGSACG